MGSRRRAAGTRLGIALTVLGGLALAAPASAAGADGGVAKETKEAGRSVGHATRDSAKAVGRGAKTAGKGIGHGAKTAGRSIAAGAKEIGHGVRKAWSGR